MDSIIALIPTVGVSVLFFFVLRAILRADRNERKALARLEEAIRGRESLSSRNSGTIVWLFPAPRV